MVKEEILTGIKQAMSQGESLQEAMQSFYNAGYEKRDIMEAARGYQLREFEKKTQSEYNSQLQSKKNITQTKYPTYSKKQFIPGKSKLHTLKKSIKNKIIPSSNVSNYSDKFQKQPIIKPLNKPMNNSSNEFLNKPSIKPLVKSSTNSLNNSSNQVSVKQNEFYSPPKASLENKQKVSDYSQKPTSPNKIFIIIILIFLLLLLVGVLVGILFFKETILSFIKG